MPHRNEARKKKPSTQKKREGKAEQVMWEITSCKRAQVGAKSPPAQRCVPSWTSATHSTMRHLRCGEASRAGRMWRRPGPPCTAPSECCRVQRAASPVGAREAHTVLLIRAAADTCRAFCAVPTNRKRHELSCYTHSVHDGKQLSCRAKASSCSLIPRISTCDPWCLRSLQKLFWYFCSVFIKASV